MLGTILICFSFACHYLARIPSPMSNPESRPWTNMRWGSVVLFLLFTTATAVLIIASAQGRFPRCALNLHCW